MSVHQRSVRILASMSIFFEEVSSVSPVFGRSGTITGVGVTTGGMITGAGTITTGGTTTGVGTITTGGLGGG